MTTLALLIDGDNAKLHYTKQIIQFCKGYGTLGTKKAYGDWNRSPLSTHRQTIINLGVTPVQQNRVGKNATDFRLAMDVASMLDKGEVKTYFIVSSDTDFTAVCERIRQKGAMVIGIGSKNSISSTLRKACNRFFDVEEIIKNQSKPLAKAAVPKSKTSATLNVSANTPAKMATLATLKTRAVFKLLSQSATPPKSKTRPAVVVPTKPPVKTAPPRSKTSPAPAVTAKPSPNTSAPKPKPLTMLALLIKAYQKTPQKDGWAHLGQLGQVLRQDDKQFDTRFANKKLSTWLKGFPDKFEVVGDYIRMK